MGEAAVPESLRGLLPLRLLFAKGRPVSGFHAAVVRRALCALATVLGCVFAPAGTALAQELHVLLVCDTHAENIGDHKFIDQDNLLRVLYRAFDEDGRRGRLHVDALTGADVTPAAVLDYYRRLQVDADDTILFYYAGHGGFDGAEHYLAMRYGTLQRSLLLGAIRTRNPRLAVVLSDSCANFPGQEPPELIEPDEGARWETVRDLLLEGSGFVDVNACAPGQFSWTSSVTGGYFTAALTYLLCQDPAQLCDDGDVSWSEMLEQVESFVEVHYSPPSPQTPHAFYLYDVPTHHFERTLVVRNDTPYRLCIWVRYLTWTEQKTWSWFGEGKFWELDPGQEGRLRDPPPEEFSVRGARCYVWASAPGTDLVWEGYRHQPLDLVDAEFGYCSETRQEYLFRFTYDP